MDKESDFIYRSIPIPTEETHQTSSVSYNHQDLNESDRPGTTFSEEKLSHQSTTSQKVS